jgi:rhodanese-related sulfurtransferase
MKIPAFVTVALLLAPVIACFAEPIDLGTRQSLSPREAASLQQEVIFLDVRTTLEWLRGHIKGAVHIPYDEVPEKVTSMIPDRSISVITYCASGGRASHVIDAMRKLGYTVVPVVDGGYRQLIANGMEKD